MNGTFSYFSRIYLYQIYLHALRFNFVKCVDRLMFSNENRPSKQIKVKHNTQYLPNFIIECILLFITLILFNHRFHNRTFFLHSNNYNYISFYYILCNLSIFFQIMAEIAWKTCLVSYLFLDFWDVVGFIYCNIIKPT